MPTNYRYINQTTANGIELHIIKTDASNIMFRNFKLGQSLTDSIFFGVNGGFFSGSTALNIAKCDGVHYGRSNNGNLGGGIICWNGTSLIIYTNRSMTDIDTIFKTNETGTWAQGGYSMWLGASDARERSLEEVHNDDKYGYLTNAASGRTALVADLDTDTIYLIVTNDSNTFTTFRKAIQYYFNIPETKPSSRYRGIMLDGSGSSQLRAKKSNGALVKVEGDGRELCQVIVMRDAT